MANNTFSSFSPSNESIDEFIERFKVQCSEQITAAGDDALKHAAVLIKALPVSVVTDLQRRLKPTILSAAYTYTEVETLLKAQYDSKKSIIGASVEFLNYKQSSNESIEHYAKTLNNLASACNYGDARGRMLL